MSAAQWRPVGPRTGMQRAGNPFGLHAYAHRRTRRHLARWSVYQGAELLDHGPAGSIAEARHAAEVKMATLANSQPSGDTDPRLGEDARHALPS